MKNFEVPDPVRFDLGDRSMMPADLAAVEADEVLIHMLGTTDRLPGDCDAELTGVLTDWRRAVCADTPLLVSTDAAAAVIRAARSERRWGLFHDIAWWFFVLVMVLFALLLVFGG